MRGPLFRFADMSRPFALAAGAFLLMAVAGCGAVPTGPSSTAITGLWGGDHISLSVDETAGRVEFDCAHGTVQGPLTADAQGNFVAPGTFVREHGGPIRQGEVPDVHPAIYAGTVTRAAMHLTIRLADANETIGTFNLTRGARGRLVKCL